jgi:hypothetical protein
MDTPRRWPWRLLLSALLAPAQTLLVRVPLRGHVCPLSQCGVRMTAEPEEPDQKRRGILWPRIRNKVSELDEHATIGESVEVITDEVDAVLAARRKRLDRKLKTSLNRFRTEVTNEADLQAKEAKERQARLKERQSLILTSLNDLREDILDEIEATVSGFKRGSKALEQSVRGLRSEWEREVNVLIDGARQDVDMAVGDIEEVIKEQREEWQRSVDLFEATWLSSYGGRKKSNATDVEGKPVFFAQREEARRAPRSRVPAPPHPRQPGTLDHAPSRGASPPLPPPSPSVPAGGLSLPRDPENHRRDLGGDRGGALLLQAALEALRGEARGPA